MKRKRVLDDRKQWTTVMEPVTEPGLHRIEIEGEEHHIESRWGLLNRLYDRAVIRFKERNEMIVTWARHFSQRDLQTLVVCTRTLHIYVLESLIKKVVHPDLVKILFSKDTSERRDEVFDWLRATPGDRNSVVWGRRVEISCSIV